MNWGFFGGEIWGFFWGEFQRFWGLTMGLGGVPALLEQLLLLLQVLLDEAVLPHGLAHLEKKSKIPKISEVLGIFSHFLMIFKRFFNDFLTIFWDFVFVIFR